MKKRLGLYLVVLVMCVAFAVGLASCNVTRTVTTTSSSYQRGDTAVMITSKTVESYDARKHITQ